MKCLKGHTIEDVAYLVCTALRDAEVTAVLSGGGAATVYAPRAHETDDLDFVLPFAVSMPDAGSILELGFAETKSRGIYGHPDLPFALEFLPGPLAVGGTVLTTWDTWEKDGLTLHIITALDCVRDRMAAAIHWHDLNSAKQAAAVAQERTIDIAALRDWCLEEGGSVAFSVFEAHYRTFDSDER